MQSTATNGKATHARQAGAPRRLILRNHQSPGDVLMLTAAVRDLHRCYPGQFETDVRTSCPAFWENNPYLTALDESDAGVETIECHYPLIHQSNQRPVHFLDGFREFLNERLGLAIQRTELRGDIHLSAEELAAPSPVAQWCGGEVPYWIIVAGGKWDYTIKWWHVARWQAVVDHFRGRLFFVQVGERGHYHPRLDGVLDVRGRTSLRTLIRLVHHAEGVFCPVTCLMHLAAAVPRPAGVVGERPCVVVAGGREPVAWERYPAHHFLHTVGMLPCCTSGGCWKARTVPLGDGDIKDASAALCLRPRRVGEGPESRSFASETLSLWRKTSFDPPPHWLPECMDRISPREVSVVIETMLTNKTIRQYDRESANHGENGLSRMNARRLGENMEWQRRQTTQGDMTHHNTHLTPR